MKKEVFKMPNPVKITGRKSSITNSFVNGIIPVKKPTEEEIHEALTTLGMTEDNICCAYCGDPYTEWDHLNPLIRNKRPTGFISEIHNLVPACGKCNQSKGNKRWREWMLGNAELSPQSRNIPDVSDRIRRLSEYEEKFTPIQVDFQTIIGKEKWYRHWDNCDRLHQMMEECQSLSDEIKLELEKNIY